MDETFIEIAVDLGVTQTELEHGYYFIDLPVVIEANRKQKAVNRFNDVMALIATSNRGMEDDEYRKFIAGLNKEIGIKPANKFDRGKFEELRMLTEMGGNMAK